MFAKSLPNALSFLDPGKFAQWVRTMVSILVLGASLTALVLIVNQLHGPRIKDAYRTIFPVEILKPGIASTKLAPVTVPEDPGHRALSAFVAKRYLVSREVAHEFVSIAHTAAQRTGLDPLLIVAVIAVESRFNPIAESPVGAKGLMQVIPKYHGDKLSAYGGERAVFDPETNIMVGSQILKEYLRRTGNLSMALQMYAGALNDEQDVYTTRVMSEKHRLELALRSAASAPAKTVLAQNPTRGATLAR